MAGPIETNINPMLSRREIPTRTTGKYGSQPGGANALLRQQPEMAPRRLFYYLLEGTQGLQMFPLGSYPILDNRGRILGQMLVPALSFEVVRYRSQWVRTVSDSVQ